MDEYDPTDGAHRALKDIQGKRVLFDIQDNVWLDSLAENEGILAYQLRDADAVISIIEPTRSITLERQEKVRFGKFRHLFDEEKQAGTLEEAVMLLWREKEMTSTSPDTEEWMAGMAQGQQFTEKAAAASPFNAWAETGSGVNEVFEELAVRVLATKNSKREATGVSKGNSPTDADSESSEGCPQKKKEKEKEERPVWRSVWDTMSGRKRSNAQ